MQIECLFSKDFTTLQTLKALVLYKFVDGVKCHHKAYLRHSPHRVLCKSLVNSWDQILPIFGKLFLPYLLIISFCGSLGTTFGFWGSNSGHQASEQVPLPHESSNQPSFQFWSFVLRVMFLDGLLFGNMDVFNAFISLHEFFFSFFSFFGITCYRFLACLLIISKQISITNVCIYTLLICMCGILTEILCAG